MHNDGRGEKTGNRARRSRLLGNKAPEGTFFHSIAAALHFKINMPVSVNRRPVLGHPISPLYPCPINFSVGHVQNEGTPLRGMMQLESPSHPRPPTPRSTLNGHRSRECMYNNTQTLSQESDRPPRSRWQRRLLPLLLPTITGRQRWSSAHRDKAIATEVS